ncbi:unnamed protein product, partial [Mesorhabditis spiculigera]
MLRRTLILISGFFCVFEASDSIERILGVRYAEPLERRYTDSRLISKFIRPKANDWPNRCIVDRPEEGTSEDCLFLSILKHAEAEKETPALVYITNEALSEEKLAKLVKKELTIIVAHVRQGVYASYNEEVYSDSDLENLFKFLTNQRDSLGIGPITVLAEEYLAEARAILFGGNALTRTYGRERFASRVASKLKRLSSCDLPSEEQALHCLRALPELFYPFGDPYRVPKLRKTKNRQIPTMYGLWKKEAPERHVYPTTTNFTADFDYRNFKQFLAGLIPDATYQNGPLVRRVALHHYVHTKGDKKDTYFLFEAMREMLWDRDFAVPTDRLIAHFTKSKANQVWLFQYGIDNPPKNCLQDGGWEDIEPFCTRLLGYYTRFASKGKPTEEGCSATNPSFPALGTSKRDYFIRIHADGTPEWDFDFYRSSVAFWRDLAPDLGQIELAGRRDAVFQEVEEPDPLEEFDDVQPWHVNQARENARILGEQAGEIKEEL